jgi:hypothetical protein
LNYNPADKEEGLRAALSYPLFDAIFQRRSRRISKGIRSVLAGSLSYSSTQEAQPLTPLEEALLIAATGTTGLTMPDMPFKTPDKQNLVGSPMLQIRGRAASSPDNAQSTSFFLINDSGTYLLSAPTGSEPLALKDLATAEALIAYTNKCKRRILDRRIDFPRTYPCYLGRNKYVSNLPGSTILVPIVDLTRQYINGLMFLLSQEDGFRPTFVDDWNFYRKAGIAKWVRSGFLNKDLPIPLGLMNTFRIHVEADLLLQNILLAVQAMGLGGWAHAGFVGPLLLGDPEYREKYGPGLGFRFEQAKSWLRRYLLRPITPLPAWRPNPVGLDGILQGLCPPYVASMDAAVDQLIAEKYGNGGLYTDARHFARIFKAPFAEKFVEEVPHYRDDVVACTKDICNYIYRTYGRFPAHVDAMYVPGIWIQAHHLDLEYYDGLYVSGYSSTQAAHEGLWHGTSADTSL